MNRSGWIFWPVAPKNRFIPGSDIFSTGNRTKWPPVSAISIMTARLRLWPKLSRDGGKIIGIGRLIADPDHETVEYAVLIADAWQKKEVGSILTDYCMEIAKRWKLKRVVAQTTTDNRPMISVFEKRGFNITYGDDSTVEVEKEIG